MILAKKKQEEAALRVCIQMVSAIPPNAMRGENARAAMTWCVSVGGWNGTPIVRLTQEELVSVDSMSISRHCL